MLIDISLEGGERVNIVRAPISPNSPIITIRLFHHKLTMEQLIEYGSISKKAAEFIKIVMLESKNVLICGGTGTGKTTFLNALALSGEWTYYYQKPGDQCTENDT